MPRNDLFDVVIVGSGPSGVMAADVLVNAGKRVALVTLGQLDDVMGRALAARQFPTVPERPFHTNWNWHTGTFLPKWREHATEGDDVILPLNAPQLRLYQATCAGGLSEAWGANCFTYSRAEMDKFHIPDPEGVAGEYDTVAQRIGLSAPKPDGDSTLALRADSILPPLELDNAHRAVLDRYQTNRTTCQGLGLSLSPSALAQLSTDYQNRLAFDYSGDEFWSDTGQSTWRAKYLLNDLIGRGLTVIENTKALQWRDLVPEDAIEAICQNLDDGNNTAIRCRRLVLCAGPINSARLASQSVTKNSEVRLPLYINRNRLLILANLNRITSDRKDYRRALSQLTLTGYNVNVPSKIGIPAWVAHLYALSPVIQASPFVGALMPTFMAKRLHAANVHYDIDSPTAEIIVRNEHNETSVNMTVTGKTDLRPPPLPDTLRKGLRHLGLRIVKSLQQPLGASIHYAGTFSDKNSILHCNQMGRLANDVRVYVADSSSWQGSSAKGLTFTLMAHARNVAKNLNRDLSSP